MMRIRVGNELHKCLAELFAPRVEIQRFPPGYRRSDMGFNRPLLAFSRISITIRS